MVLPTIEAVWGPTHVELLDEFDEGVLESEPVAEGVPIGEPVPVSASNRAYAGGPEITRILKRS
jgi:hypothetical protein